jgi:hypothetical protein
MKLFFPEAGAPRIMMLAVYSASIVHGFLSNKYFPSKRDQYEARLEVSCEVMAIKHLSSLNIQSLGSHDILSQHFQVIMRTKIKLGLKSNGTEG